MMRLDRTRAAREASWVWNLAKTLAQLVVFWTFFLLVVPGQIFRLQRSMGIGYLFLGTSEWMVAGIATLLVGSALGLTSAITMALVGKGTPLPMDTARSLVLAGPYRFVRNPMAIAGGLQVAGIGMTIGSVWVLITVAGAMFFWNEFVRPWEERDLERRFGADYAAYRDAVPCWIPRVTPYAPAPTASSS
jgi:protein-S-isoprenylcysteine O-methyltransferase Ste14